MRKHIHIVIVLCMAAPVVLLADWTYNGTNYYPWTNWAYNPELVTVITNAHYERTLARSPTWPDVTNNALFYDWSPVWIMSSISNLVVTNSYTNSGGQIISYINTNVYYNYSNQYPIHGWYTNTVRPYVYTGLNVTTTNEVDIFREGAYHFGPDNDYYLTIAQQIEVVMLDAEGLPAFGMGFVDPTTTNALGRFTNAPSANRWAFFENIGIPQRFTNTSIARMLYWYHSGVAFATQEIQLAQWVIASNGTGGAGTILSRLPTDSWFPTQMYPIVKWTAYTNTHAFPTGLVLNFTAATTNYSVTLNQQNQIFSNEIRSITAISVSNYAGFVISNNYDALTIEYLNPTGLLIDAAYIAQGLPVEMRFFTPQWFNEKILVLDNMKVCKNRNGDAGDLLLGYTNTQERKVTVPGDYPDFATAYSAAAAIWSGLAWSNISDSVPYAEVLFTGSGTNNGCTIEARKSKLIISNNVPCWPGKPYYQVYIDPCKGSAVTNYGATGRFVEQIASNAAAEIVTASNYFTWWQADDDVPPPYTNGISGPVNTIYSDFNRTLFIWWDDVFQYLTR